MNEEVAEKLEWMVGVLPEPFKTEFQEDVLVDVEEYDIRVLNKVFTYYIDDIQNELPDSVLDKIKEKYLFIEISALFGGDNCG